MLIRSQNKRILINMNNVSSLEVSDNELRIFADNGEAIYDIGEYSTKAKAIKVLDMIQEAYMDYKSGEIKLLAVGWQDQHTQEAMIQKKVWHMELLY